MIKAIIFDCFGVIAGRGFSDKYQAAGGDPKKDAEFIEDILDRANTGHITNDVFNERIAGKIGISIEQYINIANRENKINTRLVDYIKELKKNYQVAMLSNVNRDVLPLVLPEDVRSLFEVIVASAEVGLLKPDPKVFKYVANILSVKTNECVLVDDNYQNCRGAERVGMKSIAYSDFNQFKSELEGKSTNMEQP